MLQHCERGGVLKTLQNSLIAIAWFFLHLDVCMCVGDFFFGTNWNFNCRENLKYNQPNRNNAIVWKLRNNAPLRPCVGDFIFTWHQTYNETKYISFIWRFCSCCCCGQWHKNETLNTYICCNLRRKFKVVKVLSPEHVSASHIYFLHKKGLGSERFTISTYSRRNLLFIILRKWALS